jgi:hypothetical protein
LATSMPAYSAAKRGSLTLPFGELSSCPMAERVNDYDTARVEV